MKNLTVRRSFGRVLSRSAGFTASSASQVWLARLRSTPIGRKFLGYADARLAAAPRSFAATPIGHGMHMRGSTQDLIQRRIFLFGCWEPEFTHFAKQHLSPGDVVLDVGANIGYFTLLSSALVGDAGRVHAFEPVPSVVGELTHHVEANACDNVTIHPVALSSEQTTIEIYRAPGRNVGRSGTIAEPGFLSEGIVDAVRGADVVPREEWSRVKLVKVDVEGAELPALQGLVPLLDAMPVGAAVMVEYTPEEGVRRPVAESELGRLLTTAGFGLHLMPNDYSVRSYINDCPEGWTSLPANVDSQVDLLCIKQSVV